MKTVKTWCRMGLTAVVLAGLGSGCAAFRARVSEVDPAAERHQSQNFDYTDMRQISKHMVDELTAWPEVAKAEKPPVFVITDVQNQTDRHENMKNLTDYIGSLLRKTGKVRLVNKEGREELMNEQGFQAANATPGTAVAVGQQLAAKYMISGALANMESESPRQVRVSKTKISYYKFTLKVTDLQSGELLWSTEKEFAREARLPIIGW